MRCDAKREAHTRGARKERDRLWKRPAQREGTRAAASASDGAAMEIPIRRDSALASRRLPPRPLCSRYPPE